jgi:soluble lytic murein transglycosylase-like protein
VAPEPVSRLVEEAWAVGQKAGLDPTLILAIMAVESSFNPFAQSAVGAQGLMQVMTRIHDDKYTIFGGRHAAFDPVTNLRVGVQVLKECIRRAGGLEPGLRFYVGAANLDDDGGYVGKVLAEQTNLKRVARGERVPPTAPLPNVPKPANPEMQAVPEPAAPLGVSVEKDRTGAHSRQVALAR